MTTHQAWLAGRFGHDTTTDRIDRVLDQFDHQRHAGPGNFQTFLTLLTTQLQNQNPLDPLDTNQFTQQLVQFAGVEQQLKTNDQLTTLVSLQQTAQSTQALTFVGKTAVVDGSTTTLGNSAATWDLGVRRTRTSTSPSRVQPDRTSLQAATRSPPAPTRRSAGTAKAATARNGRTANTP